METDILRRSFTFRLKEKGTNSEDPFTKRLSFTVSIHQDPHRTSSLHLYMDIYSENAIISLQANGRFKVVMAVSINITVLRDTMTGRESILLGYETVSKVNSD
jgi:hypothetical protein